MRDEITIRFSGEQGSGVQYTGQLVASYLTRVGYHVFAVNDFESRIRGGYSFVQLRAGIEPGFSIKKTPDISIAFSPSSVDRDVETLSPDTCLFLPKNFLSDSIKDYKKYVLDFENILEKEQLRYVNTFFVGLMAGIFTIDNDPLKETLRDTMKKKGSDMIENNIQVADIGYTYAGKLSCDSYIMRKPKVPGVYGKAVSGSFSVSSGVAVSNCKFYAAYPMSPSTAVVNHLSGWSKELGILTEQGEDEIAVLNLALGASYAGVRAMAGTSGGGLALMSETVSLAAIAEVPIVIMNAQRPGPATGLPTRTEQGDLLFTLFMGHGEFSRVIFAPGTHEKAFEVTQKAFYLADKYHIPVFVLTDQYFMDTIKSCEKMSVIDKFQERFLDFPDDDRPYRRYRFTENGVSSRKIPGLTKFPVFADSHTHEESGYITEDSELRKKGVEKLLKKKREISEEISLPSLSTDEQRENIIIGWGSTYGVIADAVRVLEEKGFSLCHVHFDEVYPLVIDNLRGLLEQSKKILCVENNATAQFAYLLKMEGDIAVDESILKYDGRPFYLDELVRELEGNLVAG